MFKANSKSSVGKAIFYVFEASALIVGALLFILAIYNSAKTENFMTFLSGITSMISSTLILYGLGRICDLLYCKKEEKAQQKPKADTANKDAE